MENKYKWLSDEEYQRHLSNGCQTSKTYDTEEEALLFAQDLEERSKDPSFYIAVIGLYAYLDHYPQVVYRYQASFS